MDLGRGYFSWIVLLSSSVLFGYSSRAEELTIYGIPFEIDEIEQVGDSTVRLSINGKAFLVPATQVPYYILKESNIAGSLKERTLDHLRLLFDGAVIDRDSQSVEIILPLIVFQPDIQSSEVERIFKNLRTIDSNREIFDRFWAAHSDRLSPELQARLIIGIVEEGTTSIVSIVPDSELDLKIGELIEERLASLLDQGGDCTPMASALAQSFDPNNERSASILEACESGMAAKKASSVLDTASLLSIFRSVKSDLSRNIIEPFLVKALHAKAQAEIAEGRFGEALSILGDVPQRKISPTTHELILQALQGNRDILKDDLVTGSIEAMILHVVDRSPAIKSTYKTALVSSVYEAVGRKDWGTVDKGLGLLSKYEDDQNVKNKIWYEVAVKAVRVGDRERGLAYFNSQSAPLSFIRKLQFYIQGGYGMRYLLLLPPILLIIFVNRWRVFVRSRRGREFADISVNLSGAIEPTESNLSPDENRELNKSLYRLGLKPHATEQDIKNAFRDIAKKIHPDKNSSEQGIATSDEFVELTKAYDLAIKLKQKQLEA